MRADTISACPRKWFVAPISSAKAYSVTNVAQGHCVAVIDASNATNLAFLFGQMLTTIDTVVSGSIFQADKSTFRKDKQ